MFTVISTSPRFKSGISNMISTEQNVTIIDLDNLPQVFETGEEKVILIGRYPLVDYKRYSQIDQLLPNAKFVQVNRSKKKMAEEINRAIES